MKSAKTIAIATAATIGVSILGTLAALRAIDIVGTINPRDVYTYIAFNNFKENMEPSDPRSFEEVSEFVSSHYTKTLIARCVPTNEDYHYTFKTSEGHNLTCYGTLENWDAVRKYLYVENKIKESKKNKTPCNLHNHGPNY